MESILPTEAGLNFWSAQWDFLQGVLTTARLSIISAVLALGLGFWMAFARNSRHPWLNRPAAFYVEIFRNTPLLIQLYFYYRGLQSVGLVLSPEVCGVLALSLYTGAYATEVFRAGLLGIPPQQTEAGLSLGLKPFHIYRLILLPQAIRAVLPALGNQMISLVKNSSLLAFITVNDLFLVTYKGAVDRFLPIQYFVEGAALYWLLSLGVSLLFRSIGRLPAFGGVPLKGAHHGG